MLPIPESEGSERNRKDREEGGQNSPNPEFLRQGEPIKNWIVSNLGDNQNLNVLASVDFVLAQLEALENISCALLDEGQIRFYTRSQLLCDVHISNARAKLRMMCARLAAMCNDQGQEISPYGGQAEFMYEISPGKFVWAKLYTANTPDDQKFILEKQSQ